MCKSIDTPCKHKVYIVKISETKAIFYIPNDVKQTPVLADHINNFTCIEVIGGSGLTSVKGLFDNCDKLTNIDMSEFNTHNVEDMSNMFRCCNSLHTLDLVNFITDNVQTMEAMFYGCANLREINLSSFNTVNVKDMCDMFNSCPKLFKVKTDDARIKQAYADRDPYI